MNKHITKILIERGYKTYRYSCMFPDQNANAKHQNLKLLERDDLIFVKGDRNSDIKRFYYPYEKYNDFSSMIVGGIDIRFVKDLDFDNEIIWGLREANKPPTLVYPRPNIKVKRYVYSELLKKDILTEENELYDDSMNLCISRENPEDILKACYDKNIKFKYDLT